MQGTECAYLNASNGAIVMRMNNVIRRAAKDTIDISLKSVGTKQCIWAHRIVTARLASKVYTR
jgi:hypothetical protein